MKKLMLFLVMVVFLGTSCSVVENPTVLNQSGTSNNTPIYVSYPTVTVTVNQTDVTGWLGRLADNQPVSDLDIETYIENNSHQLGTNGISFNDNGSIYFGTGGDVRHYQSGILYYVATSGRMIVTSPYYNILKLQYNSNDATGARMYMFSN